MNTLDPLAVLEDWRFGHKSRAVTISIDNGYGATCWEVVLNWHGPDGKTVEAIGCEAKFWGGEPLPNVKFVDWSLHDDDWPGLGPTILAAVEKAEEMGALRRSTLESQKTKDLPGPTQTTLS